MLDSNNTCVTYLTGCHAVTAKAWHLFMQDTADMFRLERRAITLCKGTARNMPLNFFLKKIENYFISIPLYSMKIN